MPSVAQLRAPLGGLDARVLNRHAQAANPKSRSNTKVGATGPTSSSAAPRPTRAPAQARKTEAVAVSDPSPLDGTAVQQAALKGLLTLGLNAPDEPVVAHCRMHARLLIRSRRPEFVEFEEKLQAEARSNKLCFIEGADIRHDFGLRDRVRALLLCYSDEWLRPALAVVLHDNASGTTSAYLEMLLGVAVPTTRRHGGVSAASRTKELEESGRVTLCRIITLLALLDDAAVASIGGPSSPPPLRPSSPYRSTCKVLQQLQQICLAKQGDVTIRLRRLGACCPPAQPSCSVVPHHPA